jgi:hypothetical protein
MAIVSFEVDLKQDDTTWEMRKAQLAAMPEVPYSQIDLSDIPEVTDFSGFMTVEEAKAYRAARKKQTTAV